MEKLKSDSIRAAYAGFNGRDIDSVLSLMTRDIDWPNAMEGGRALGQDEVRAYWTRQWGVLDPHVEPVRIEEDPNGTVVVHVHQVVRDLSGKVLVDQFVQHVYSFQGDRISRMDIREDHERE